MSMQRHAEVRSQSLPRQLEGCQGDPLLHSLKCEAFLRVVCNTAASRMISWLLLVNAGLHRRFLYRVLDLSYKWGFTLLAVRQESQARESISVTFCNKCNLSRFSYLHAIFN